MVMTFRLKKVLKLTFQKPIGTFLLITIYTDIDTNIKQLNSNLSLVFTERSSPIQYGEVQYGPVNSGEGFH